MCLTVGCVLALGWGFTVAPAAPDARKPDLQWRGTILGQITPAEKVTKVGAFSRTERINPKEKLTEPEVRWTAKVDKKGNFQITGLPEGTYDLVIMTTGGVRIEGYHLKLARANEEVADGMADKFENEDAPDPDDLAEDEVELDEHGNIIPKDPDKNRKIPADVGKIVTEHIRKMVLYENKHRPLDMIGDKKQAAVLMELIRDRKTSYDGDNPYGGPIATLRYELWTFTNWYGGWTRDRQVKVLHRVIMARNAFRKQTWMWESSLGGLVVKKDGKVPKVTYKIPDKPDPKKGLVPY